MTAEPETIAAAVLKFERDLTAPLAATLDNLDALAIRDACISGLRLTIEHLDDCVTGARDGAMKAAYETQLQSAERQLGKVRALEVGELAALLGGTK